jgi:peptidoglycan/LPS O-acetylase OafA/YrhL
LWHCGAAADFGRALARINDALLAACHHTVRDTSLRHHAWVSKGLVATQKQKQPARQVGSLRTLFSLTVVFAHSPWNAGYIAVGGQNAVQLFYMISGFLISYIIATNPSYSKPSRFYLNRALRIYPVYYVVAILTLVARVIGDPQFFDIYRDTPATAAVWLAFANLALFGQDWLMFAGVNDGQLVFAPDFNESEYLLYTGLLLPQAWTLGVELSFYALAPFIVRNRKTMLLLLFVSLAVRGALIWMGRGTQDPWSYRFFPAELSLFLLGALSAQYLLPFWKGVLASGRQDRLPKLATYMLIALSACYFLIPGNEQMKKISLFVIFLAFLPLAFIYQSTSRIDNAIGELSYPIYIGHMLVLMVFGVWAKKHGITSEFVITAGNVVFASAFAYILNKCISGPVERVRAIIRSANQ